MTTAHFPVQGGGRYSWFIGMGLGLGIYLLLARRSSITATSLRTPSALLPAQPSPQS